MADPLLSVPENVAGDFFVDASCIDCDTCRQVAPLVFDQADGHSFVRVQPGDESTRRDAARALLCCPTASIGARGSEARAAVAAAVGDFPLSIAADVWDCGFTSEQSFGAHSYLLHHPDGNWLIDAPRWQPQLVAACERLGGVSRIFLTHQDDVADAGRYARHFSARVLIHARDRQAYPGADVVIAGDDIQEVASGLQAVPVPGHTAGSMALLAPGRFLFSGDHLWWSRVRGRLSASRSACWHSWGEQIASMRRLIPLGFRWVLPGHGTRVELSPERMAQALAELVAVMETEEEPDD
jgi:glyoxylase-like metal-dependent hydrolase (beta-lactamase superfamily II)/ferredoxin